jgi:hypothetical protein
MARRTGPEFAAARHAWTVLARVLSVAADRGKITCNPCAKGGRLYSGSRRDNIWTAEDEATFLAGAPRLRLTMHSCLRPLICR